MIKVSAPGATFYFGEHSVVYGKLAIAATVSKRIFLELSESDGHEVFLDDEGVGKLKGKIEGDRLKIIFCDEKLKPAVKMIDRLLSMTDKRTGFKIRVKSDLPTAAGMMSSAAFSTCLNKALCKYWGIESDLMELVFMGEKDIQGPKSSKTGAACTILGGMVELKDGIPKKFDAKPMHVVLARRRGDKFTKLMVEHVAKLKEKNPEEVEKILDAMDFVAINGKKALIEGNARRVGDLMNINHGLLASLGVTYPDQERLIYTARRAGALGSKQVGGCGPTGTVTALVDSKETAKRVKDAWQELSENIDIFDLEIGVEGARFE